MGSNSLSSWGLLTAHIVIATTISICRLGHSNPYNFHECCPKLVDLHGDNKSTNTVQPRPSSTHAPNCKLKCFSTTTAMKSVEGTAPANTLTLVQDHKKHGHARNVTAPNEHRRSPSNWPHGNRVLQTEKESKIMMLRELSEIQENVDTGMKWAKQQLHKTKSSTKKFQKINRSSRENIMNGHFKMG